MSKHHHHEECCYPQMYGYGMTGGFGGGAVASGGGYGCGGGGMGIRWIYALLILIVIVLQFGRNRNQCAVAPTGCCEDGSTNTTACGTGGFLGFGGCNQLIDNSVLFIIVVFLLILCAGCFGAGTGAGYGAGYGAGGFGGGYGYY